MIGSKLCIFYALLILRVNINCNYYSNLIVCNTIIIYHYTTIKLPTFRVTIILGKLVHHYPPHTNTTKHQNIFSEIKLYILL